MPPGIHCHWHSQLFVTRNNLRWLIFRQKYNTLKCWHLGRSYGAKSDIWSMGCVLYELVELKKAYEGESLSSLLIRIARVNA
jgi:serine/threonine protein kinase